MKFLIIDRLGLYDNVPRAHILKDNTTLCGVKHHQNNLNHRISPTPTYFLSSGRKGTTPICKRCEAKTKAINVGKV